MSRKIVVVGLGNRFLHDDAVGIRVAEELKEREKERSGDSLEGVRIEQYEEMDLSLLQEFKGASRLIIVDSMKSGTRPGTVSLFKMADESGEVDSLPSLHELELSDMIHLARKIGFLTCPVVIVGIEPADLTVGEGLSKELESAVPVAVQTVVAQLSSSGVP